MCLSSSVAVPITLAVRVFFSVLWVPALPMVASTLVGGEACFLSYMFFAALSSNFWSAAWVQAVGLIAAILVAMYVPTKLEIKRQEKRARRA